MSASATPPLRAGSLDRRRGDATQVNVEPFPWVRFAPLLDGDSSHELATTFPAELLAQAASARGHYRLRDCTLVDDGEMLPAVQALSRSWRHLLDTLAGGEYASWVGGLLGVDLSATVLKVRPCEYGSGDFMQPHTDQASRVVTQILYLSPDWDPAWGGGLNILRSSDPEDVAAVVSPTLGSSVAFARSDHSWHAVQPVRAGAGATRRSLLIQWYRPEDDR